MDRYVYVLKVADVVFYVGKGTHADQYRDKYRRVAEHLREATLPIYNQANPAKCKAILSAGEQLICEIVADNLSEAAAVKLECELIAQYKRICDGGTLTNIITSQSEMAAITRNKPVYCYSKAGELLFTFTSLKAAWKQTGVRSSIISRCCKGVYRLGGGYVWSTLPTFPGYNKYVPWDAIAVDQYTIDGTFVTTYTSASEAECSTGIKQSSINANVNGKSRTAGNYVWTKRGQAFELKPRTPPGRPKIRIQQIDPNNHHIVAEFTSVTEAITQTGFTGIWRCINGITRTAGGYFWTKTEE